VLFFQPEQAGADWTRGELIARAQAIPGVNVFHDPGGREMRRFGAETSGQTMLYDAGGTLRFRGGITASRGHEGDNPGRSAIVASLGEGTVQRATTPVFGCSLVARSAKW